MEPLEYYTLGIIALTCWISYLGFRDRSLESRLIFWPQAILGSRQYYRLITSGVLHADGIHLLMNMMTLYFFGSVIGFVFGGWQLLLIYVAGIVGGNLLSLAIHRFHDYRAYGASGGVCGVMFAYIILFPGGSISMYFLPFGIPCWLYATGFLAASFVAMRRQKDNIGHDAHIGGALIGFFTAAALHPSAARTSPILFTSIAAASVALYLYLSRNPLMLPFSNFTSKRRSCVPSYLQRERDIDAVLQKISEKGIHSLTKEEHALLNSTSEKYRRRATTAKPESFLPF